MAECYYAEDVSPPGSVSRFRLQTNFSALRRNKATVLSKKKKSDVELLVDSWSGLSISVFYG